MTRFDRICAAVDAWREPPDVSVGAEFDAAGGRVVITLCRVGDPFSYRSVDLSLTPPNRVGPLLDALAAALPPPPTAADRRAIKRLDAALTAAHQHFNDAVRKHARRGGCGTPV